MKFSLNKNTIDPEFVIYSDEHLTNKTPYSNSNKYLQTEVERIHHAFRVITHVVKKGGTVLEVGASPFYLSYLLSKYHDMKIDAMFYSNDKHELETKEFAYYKGGNIKLIHQDINKIDQLENNIKYDLMISMECIEHLDQFPFQFFEYAKSNLVNNGMLYITVPNVCSIANILKLIANKNVYMPYRPDTTGRHKFEYTVNEIKNIIQDCMGFDIIKLTTFSKKSNWKIQLTYDLFSCLGLCKKHLPTIELLSSNKQKTIGGCNWSQLSREIYTDDRSTEA